jgi:hypothetical protein
MKKAPRTPEKAHVLYRGTVQPFGQSALSALGSGTLPHTSATYKAAAKGVHTTSDIKTARLYADAGSFIAQQKGEATSRDQDNWTIGVINRLDNTANKLAAKVARPKGLLARFDKAFSHYLLGRTEFVVPEVADGAATVHEVYLFRGDILQATFTDKETALTALAGHLKYLETGEGSPIEQQEGAKINRRTSTIETDASLPSALTGLVKSKVQRVLRKP